MPSSESSALRHVCPALLLLGIFSFSLVARWDLVSEGWALRAFGTARFWNGEALTDFHAFLLSYDLRAWSWEWPLLVYPPNALELEAGKGLLAGPFHLHPHLGTSASPVLATQAGHFAYLSFPPGAFLFAYGVLKAAGGLSSPMALQMLGLSLQLMTTLMLYGLLWRGWFCRLPGRQGAWLAAFCSTPYLLAVQPLHDHATTFWAHHVFQPILLLSLLMLLWRPEGAGQRGLRVVAFGLLAGLAAGTEWTGYILVGGLVLASLAMAWATTEAERRHHLLCLVSLALGGLLAGLAVLLLHGNAVGLENYLVRLTHRAEFRSDELGNRGLADYFASVAWSMGPYLALLVLLGMASLPLLAQKRHRLLSPPAPASLVLMVAGLCCLENLLLHGHAVSYPFAQLKLVVFLSLCLAAIFSFRAAGQHPGGRPSLWGPGLAYAGAGLLSLAAYTTLYGDRVQRQTGQPLSQSSCMTGWQKVAGQVQRWWRPGDELLVSTDIHPAEILLGHVPVQSHSIGVALDALKASRFRKARFFIASGQGFDGLNTPLTAGHVSADILLSQDSEVADFRLHSSSVSQTGDGFQLTLHNTALAALLPEGMRLQGEDGERWKVTGRPGPVVVAVAVAVAAEETSGRSASRPEQLVFRLPLSEDLKKLAFSSFAEMGKDRLGCSYGVAYSLFLKHR